MVAVKEASELLLASAPDREGESIRVGGQQQLGGFLHRDLEQRDLLPFVAGHDVVRSEVLIDVDAEPTPLLLLDLLRHVGRRLREVADMAIACLDAVLVAEEAAECLRLRRRFDDHERFCHYAVFTLTRPLRANETAAPDSPDETV